MKRVNVVPVHMWAGMFHILVHISPQLHVIWFDTDTDTDTETETEAVPINIKYQITNAPVPPARLDMYDVGLLI